MRKRTAVLLVVGLAVTYVGSYLFYSKDGVYVPLAFGAGKGPNGKMVLRSKRIGLIWEPFGSPISASYRRKSSEGLQLVYWPLVALDRAIWHQRLPETEVSYYSDYF